MTRRVVQGGTAVTLLAGVFLQFLQQTDPVYPLLYFTVCSALLDAAVLSRLSWRPSAERAGIEIAAVVGVLLSALVYTTVIAPSSPSGNWFNAGDDLFVRIATILMHGVAPVLVTVEYLTRATGPRLAVRHAFVLLWWPMTYLVVVAALDALGLGKIPYPFLRLAESGGPAVIVAVLVLGLVQVLLGLGLVMGRRWIRPSGGGRIDDPSTSQIHRS